MVHLPDHTANDLNEDNQALFGAPGGLF